MLKWRIPSWRVFFQVTPSPGSSPAPRVRPIMISKLNTVLQLAVVGACVAQELSAWPGAAVIDGLAAATLATTVASGLQYVRLYHAGKLL